VIKPQCPDVYAAFLIVLQQIAIVSSTLLALPIVRHNLVDTHGALVPSLPHVKDHNRKRKSLKEAGLLHSNPEGVRDPLFKDHPEFFDPLDLLQVRYEMLRAHKVDGENIVAISDRYGVSRQTFYNLWEKFSKVGSAALLSGKPGPKGASKLTLKVVSFARQQLVREADLSGSEVASRIEAKFRLKVHKRTIEKLLGELRSKKNY
jgi:transposase